MPEAHIKPCYMAGTSLEPSSLLMEKHEGLDNQQERMMNDLNWLIGIIEGEGCFTLGIKRRKYPKKNKAYFPQIQITNTNIKMITEIRKIISAIGLPYYFYCQLPKNGAPYYRIEIPGLKRVKKFLDLTIDLFRCRGDQAKLLLDYVNLRLRKPVNTPLGEEEDAIARQLYILNGKHKNSSLSSETNTQDTFNKSDDRVRPFAKA